MRLLAEILIVVALIVLGWEKSFHQSLGDAPVIGRYFGSTETEHGASAPSSKSSAGLPSPPPKPRSDLLEPGHRTILDRPVEPPNKTFSGHILYTDDNGAKYWLDAQGQRHYTP